jgi:predicted DNA-binding transcriptional regulator AlpA
MATAKRDLTDPRVQGHQPTGEADQLMSLRDVADLLEVSPNTIYYWRYQGTGPKGHRVGRWIRYWRSDVLAWMSERADPVSGLSHIRLSR